MGEKLPKTGQKWRPYWIFAHKMAKNQNFENSYIRFVELLTRKVHAKYQVPSMYAVQMNVPFVLYKKSRVKVRAPIVISHKPQFSKINCAIHE